MQASACTGERKIVNKEANNLADFKDKKTVISQPEAEPAVHHDVEVGTADDVAEIMKKYDRESNTRIYEGIPQKILHYLLAAFALFVMWMNLFATWGEQFRRPLFLGLVILFVFALYPARKGHPGKVNRIPWYDIILALVGACSFFYFVINNQSILQRATRITDLEIVLGVIGILVLAECCRRVVGLPILCVASCFVIYAFVAGKTLKSIIYNLFYTTTGVIGTPIGVCSTFIVLFIIFGAFLEATGISDFFIACANRIAGIIAGVVTMTGLGQIFISAIVGIAGNNLMIALVLTMITCIILGMGVPTTANYVIMATTCAPILTTGMGMSAMAANMFVFYFGIVADITPPVALAAYAGSAIAKSSPMRTALNASRLAIAAFLVPYVFALNPAMLFIDTVWYEVVLIAVSSFIGMISISVALEGYLIHEVNPFFRILCAAGGLALLIPGTLSDLAGLVALAIVLAAQIIENKRRKSKASEG